MVTGNLILIFRFSICTNSPIFARLREAFFGVMRKSIVAVFVTCFVGVVIPSATAAAECLCDELSPLEKASAADVIFTGVVTHSFAFGGNHLITFVVDEVIAGELPQKVQVSTQPQSQCGYQAARGEKHLIFASGTPDALEILPCSGSENDPSLIDIQLARAFADSAPAAERDICAQVITHAVDPDSGACSSFATPCDVPLGWELIERCPVAGDIDFPDVARDHPYRDGIIYIVQEGYASGFEDGSFRPEAVISRAAFAKIVTSALFPSGQIQLCPAIISTNEIFPDVPVQEWFAPYVCTAKLHNIVSGYPDGTFAPHKNIGFPAVAKMLVEAFDIPVTNAKGEWYVPYLVALSERNAIPSTVESVYHLMTRGEVAEMIYRLETGITDKPSNSAAEVMKSSQACTRYKSEHIAGIDMERVRRTWLEWHNAERAKYGLDGYRLDDHLSYTAGTWSAIAAERGYIDHKRSGQTAYYDYPKITKWFRDLGITFANRSGITYSESIAWGPWRCDETDCTDELIEDIRISFDFYLGERGDQYRPHYDAIVSNGFRIMGMNVTLDEASRKFYLTTHYGTEITSDPWPMCG